MTRPKITLHDVETNEIVEREMNDQEFTIYQQQQAKAAADLAEAQAAAAARQALLDKLGITADEAKLLLGGA